MCTAAAELDLLGLPEDDWLKPAPAKWRRLRQKPHTSIDAELPEMELPSTDKVSHTAEMSCFQNLSSFYSPQRNVPRRDRMGALL